MPQAISFLETSAIIEKELDYTQLNNGVTYNQQIVYDNRYNLESEPSIIVSSPDATILYLRVSNLTTGSYVIIDAMLIGDITLTKYWTHYNNGTELDATYNAPFFLRENAENVIQFSFIPNDATLNLKVTWKKACDQGKTLAYLDGFTIQETNNYKQINKVMFNTSPDNILDTVEYKFSINRLWYETYFLDDDKKTTYRITYKTDDGISEAITKQVWYLCGCVFDNLEISGSGSDLNKENISGIAEKKFRVADVSNYFMSPFQITSM